MNNAILQSKFYLENKMSKFEMIKKLEYLIAFQSNCLQQGDWKDFDLLENSIKKLETEILKANSQ